MRRPRPLAFQVAVALAMASFCLVPASQAASDAFTVLSYNVENWLVAGDPAEPPRAPSSLKPEAEKDAVISIIARHRPAVLGVVEMGSRKALDDFRARLKAKGLDYAHTEWHQGLDPDRHVAVLTRFPIVERSSQEQVDFDLAGKPQGIQRGILDITIEPKPGYRLRLIGLHLKSQRKAPTVDEASLRAKEAWFVRQYIDAILAKAPSTRLLVFGDFNDTKNEYAIRAILGPRTAPTHLTDIAVQDSRGERWTHYFKTADEYSRIDYFMASPALLPEISGRNRTIDDSPEWNAASDHRAIFLTVNPPNK
jgi:endonuclease/exonuclease/phosphatase family metal-dependent hydrolase